MEPLLIPTTLIKNFEYYMNNLEKEFIIEDRPWSFEIRKAYLELALDKLEVRVEEGERLIKRSQYWIENDHKDENKRTPEYKKYLQNVIKKENPKVEQAKDRIKHIKHIIERHYYDGAEKFFNK